MLLTLPTLAYDFPVVQAVSQVGAGLSHNDRRAWIGFHDSARKHSPIILVYRPVWNTTAAVMKTTGLLVVN